MRKTAVYLLMLGSSLSLAGCPRSTPPSENQRGTRVRTSSHVEDADSAIGGSYQCRLRTPDDDQSGPCEISAAGDAFELRMQLGTQELSGAAERTSYGLRFEGSLNQMPVTADLIRQGAGSFGAVLQLEDKSLYKLDISPSD